MSNLPPGCPFEPRWLHVCTKCSQRPPKLYPVAPGHLARCILHDSELATQLLIRPDVCHA